MGSTPTSLGFRFLFAAGKIFDWQVSTGDVRTEFSKAPVADGERVGVIPPVEEEADGSVIWRCRKALYGFRRSPKLFQAWLTRAFRDAGWTRCKATCSLFRHFTGALLSTHVDDLAMAAPEAMAEQLRQGLEERMQLKRGPVFDQEW